jgi:glycosyltransferase involved in cell wall biosynthesis
MSDPMPPSLSVIICSLNGASGVARCLRSLRAQTLSSELEVIVVDDGSTDATSDVARAAGAIVVRHASRLGPAAARNTGIKLAMAPMVAFLDDDCDPCPEWAEKLLAAFAPGVIAVGGALCTSDGPGMILSYLGRHNPLDPQELNIARSNTIRFRFVTYLGRQWMSDRRSGSREVAMLPAANMAVRRRDILQVGGFDDRIEFAAEDDDLCRRLLRAFPGKRLMYEPEARVVHYFVPSLRDVLRRSRAYGVGSALMYRKWPEVPPTFFPFPAIVLGLLISSIWFPLLTTAAVLAPHLFYPQGFRAAVRERRAIFMVDAYLQLLQEACDNYGFIQGLWRFRRFPPELSAGPVWPVRAEKSS